MYRLELEEEVMGLRGEVVSLKEQVGQLLATNAQLREEFDKYQYKDKYKNERPSFVKG